MYSTILVPIDINHPDAAGVMLRRAQSMATPDAIIFAVTVIQDMPPYTTSELPQGYLEQMRINAGRTLDAIVAETGVKAVIDIRSGAPAHTILELSKERAADLIIIASHRPDFTDYLLGSTAARIVRHATCSVLVIR